MYKKWYDRTVYTLKLVLEVEHMTSSQGTNNFTTAFQIFFKYYEH